MSNSQMIDKSCTPGEYGHGLEGKHFGWEIISHKNKVSYVSKNELLLEKKDKFMPFLGKVLTGLVK